MPGYGSMTISKEPKSVQVRLNLDKLPIPVQGEKVSNKFGSVVKLSVAFAIVASVLTPIEAIAVTYGNPVSDPLSKAPYVVSIWKSDRGDVQQAEFICSGTLISNKIVLTAAHCTDFDNSSFFVKVGAVALGQELPLYPATPWTGTRYDPKSIDGDIGLLRLNTTVPGIAFPSLANASIAKQISTKTQLTLMGWGIDQNKKLADTLHYSNLLLQDTASKAAWGKYFNVKTMISAGKYIKNERKWSGSCNGDSGGPLLATFSGITYVVGVTSWGANDCRIEKPSVFSRVSYFEKDIRAGIKAVEILAGTVNRLAPIEVVAPSMLGDGTPGTPMTCDVGKWENVVSLSIEWLSPSRMVGITSASTKIISADAGQEFKCRIVARSKSGSSETSVVRVVSEKLVKKLSVASAPVIGGLQGSEIVAPGTVARCEAWNWAEPVDSERVEWFTTSVSNPTTPINGKLIGSGAQLTLTEDILKTERGRYLVCQLTGMRDGFPNYLAATKFLASPNAPIISDVSVRASSLKSGSQATCSYASNSTTDSATYEWGYTGAGNAFTPFGGQNADFIQLNANILKTASGQKLACKVTLAYQGVASTRIGTSVDIFESALEAPKVSISIPSNLYSGSSATCSVPYNSKYLSTTYEWGISNSPQSSFFISGVLSRGLTFTFDSLSLIKSAGSYLTCVVTVENDLGKAQGFSSSQVNISAAPALPLVPSPVVSKQAKDPAGVIVTIMISAPAGFDSNLMEMNLNLPGSNCESMKIYSLPATINCTGLNGNSSYSASTILRYSGNLNIPARQSATTSFTSIDNSAAPSITLSNAGQSITVNSSIAPIVPLNVGGPIGSSGYSVSPALPSGLNLNTSSGVISGTPTSVQTLRTYTVTAIGPGGTSTASFSLAVVAQETRPVISLSNSSQSVTVNTAISNIVPTNSGGTISPSGFTVSPSLPNGLSLNPSTGVISGIPSTIQSQQSYTMTASGPAGTSSAIFLLAVTAQELPPSISIQNGTQSVVAGTSIVPTSVLNSGGAISISGFSISPNLPSGLNLNSSTGVITGAPTSAQAQRNYVLTAVGSGGSSTANFLLTVTAPVVDSQSPVVVSTGAVISASSVVSGASVTATLRATDDVAVSQVSLALVNASNSVLITTSGVLISGDERDGSYRGSLTVPAGTPVGTYRVIARAGDASGKYSLGNSGVSQYVLLGTIAVTLPPDDQAPTLTANLVQVSPSVINENGSITVVVPGTDNVGIDNISVTMVQNRDFPTTPAQTTTVVFNLVRTSGTIANGTWSASKAVNLGGYGILGEGYYNLIIRATDAAGNVTEVILPNAFMLSYQTSGPYIVNTSTLPISTPLMPGGFFKVQTRLFSYGHKISSATVRSDGSNMNFSVPLSRISGTSSDGIYEATISLASNQAAGTFVYWIEAGTDNGRAGTRVDVPVVITGPDLTGPTVASYSGTLSSPSITGQVVSVLNIGNISDGMATNSDFTVTFQASDNVAISSAIVCVDTSSEDRLTGIVLNVTGQGSFGRYDGVCLPASLISGSSSNGTYSASGHFPTAASLSAMSIGACGRYTVRAQATDTAGNRSAMTTIRKIDIVTCTS